MNSQLYQTIELISREKGLDIEVIIKAVEEAMTTAAKKFYRSGEDLFSRFNQQKGQVEVFARKKVVTEVADPSKEITLEEAQKIDPVAEVGSEIEVPKLTNGLGRIAAQTAKQVILQKVYEAERDSIYNEYINRVGEIVNGIVKRFEWGDIIIDLGREAEAILSRKELPWGENFSQGDRIRSLIMEVKQSGKGPQVVVSRAAPRFLYKLFEMEVPEISDNIIEIKNVVREAGDRAKVAVCSKVKDIDPVGACVGIKGNRVHSIIRELRREKIDIVEYSNNPNTYITNALNPAKIKQMTILDEKERHIEVIVEDNQLSLAIGRKGQNVRLASKLTSWKIDIKSETEKREEEELERELLAKSRKRLAQLPGIDEQIKEQLLKAGFGTLERLSSASSKQLAVLLSIGNTKASQLIAEAKKLLTAKK